MIIGSAALVIKSLQTLGTRLTGAFQSGLNRGLLYAAGVSQREFLSGPRPAKLDIRTRRLLQSISTEVVVDGNKVIGRIGSNVKYAAFHEFGFHGTESVRAHTRVVGHVGSKGESLPTRKAVMDNKGNVAFYQDIRPGFVRMGLSNFKGLGTVKAHTRKVDYAGRPFIGPALEKSLNAITTSINQSTKSLSEGGSGG
jgi:hypothetical protein